LPIPDTPYSVVERGANHRIWQKFSYETTVDGQVFEHSHSYTEIATGLAHLVGNQWVDSSPEIQITASGAQATSAQHSIAFLANLNASGAVDVMTPEGRHLISNIEGLSYFDTATSSSVLIGTIKDSTGQLLDTKDRALFQDAFSGLSADVLYVNSIGGFEQLVVLTAQLPSPTQWNMDPSTVLLQVITEFLNPPSPQVTPFQDNNGADQHLDFGIMKMGLGYAFVLGSEENKVRVTKEWLVQDGRTFLIESVRLTDILPLMQDLPPLPPGSARLSTPPGSATHQLASNRRVLPPKLAANTAAHSAFPTPQSALSSSSSALHVPHSALVKGLALDYTMLTTQTNFLAQSDTTYYVSGSVSLSGSNVFVGGAVIKYATNGSITLQPGATTPSVTFVGSSYRPIVFCAKDDNAVGTAISGSTGSPTGYYANPALNLVSVSPSAPGLSNARFAYAKQALQLAGSNAVISDAQFINCQQGLVVPGGGTFNLRNALFANTQTNVVMGSNVTVTAENVTFSGSAYLGTGPSSSSSSSFSLTNCILSNVTNLFAGVLSTNADYNGFYQSPSFGTDIAPALGSYPFQTVGGGSFYLAVSQYRGIATTNIAPALLSDLRGKTTWPPIAYTNATLTNGGNWWPQAQRETAGIDLGVGYVPLDYTFGGCTLNTNLTFAAGTAVGWFRTSSGWYHAGQGIHVADGKSLTFSGTATQPDYWVRCTTVQEQDRTGGYGPGGITGWTWPDFSQTPLVSMRFTRCSILAWEADHMRDDNGYLIVHARDCEFWGGGCNGYCSQLNYTNCLFDDVSVWTQWNGVPSTNCTFIFQNCLMHLGALNPSRSAPDANGNYCLWSIHDSAFDGTAIGFSDAAAGNPSWTAFDYNAYLTNANTTSPAGAHDQTVTNFNFRSGPLGGFYLPSSSSLINTGSVANAGMVGLYHYSLITNTVNGLEIQRNQFRAGH
jgi:hypothetical protein